jgi:hypothetical protein
VNGMDDGWEGGREEGKGVGRQAKEFRGKETKKKKNLLLISGWLVLSLYTPIFQYFTIKKITFTVNTLCIETLI